MTKPHGREDLIGLCERRDDLQVVGAGGLRQGGY